jgi:hypothetical protein
MAVANSALFYVLVKPVGSFNDARAGKGLSWNQLFRLLPPDCHHVIECDAYRPFSPVSELEGQDRISQ